MFSELDNVDVLFRLGGLPRIAVLTTGHPGLFQFVKYKGDIVVKVDVVIMIVT